MKSRVELRVQHFVNNQWVETWEIAKRVGTVGGDPLVRRVDGLLEVVHDHSRIREMPKTAQKMTLDDPKTLII